MGGTAITIFSVFGGMCILDNIRETKMKEQIVENRLENYCVAFINDQDLCIRDMNGTIRVLQKNIISGSSLMWYNTISYSKRLDRIFYSNYDSICSIKPDGSEDRTDIKGKIYSGLAVSDNGDLVLKWYSGTLFTSEGVDFLRRGSKRTESWSEKFRGAKRFQWAGDSLCYYEKGNIYMGDILLGNFGTDVFSVSPDKKYLAYGKDGLYLREIGSGKTKKLARGMIKNIDWSQDSQFITYAEQLTERYVHSEIYIIDREGSYSKKIVDRSIIGRPIFIPKK